MNILLSFASLFIADFIMMVKNQSINQFFWINSHVNSLLELTFTLTRLFWHLLTLTCSICAMLAEWSEQRWTSQTLLPLHAVAWFLLIVWPPSESQLVAFCSWWRKWNTCTCILQRFNVILSIYSLEKLSDQSHGMHSIIFPTNELQWALNSDITGTICAEWNPEEYVHYTEENIQSISKNMCYMLQISHFLSIRV